MDKRKRPIRSVRFAAERLNWSLKSKPELIRSFFPAAVTRYAA